MNQAISFEELYHQIMEALYLIDEALGTYSRLIDVYLTDDKNIFAIVAQNGKLYKQHFIVEDDDLMIGDFEEIPLEDDAPMTQGFRVIQQENGLYRWFGIAATTALNNNGNLNSKKLYDSFIDYINETGEYPILNFYHQPNTRLGIADFAARDDNLYILSGTFDNTKYGLAAANGMQSDPDYWGQSIEFWYQDMEWYTKEVEGVKVQIPIFTKGINDATSILPVNDAACLGTGIISKNLTNGGLNMNEKVKAAAAKLLGVELADEFENQADTVNQEINETMVHQSTEDIFEDAVEEVGEVVESVIELDETFITDLLPDLIDNEGFNQAVQQLISDAVAPMQQRINQLQNELNQLRQSQQTVEVAIQESEVSQRERWNNDRPSQATRVSYRARGNQVANEPVSQNGSYVDKANSTLSKIKVGVK